MVKAKGSTTVCTPVRSANNKGEVVWKPNYKLALLKFVETEEESISKVIMSNLHTKTK